MRQIFTWGSNLMGQLGHFDKENYLSCVMLLTSAKKVMVAAGSSHSLLSKESNGVYSFGNNLSGQLGEIEIHFIEY